MALDIAKLTQMNGSGIAALFGAPEVLFSILQMGSCPLLSSDGTTDRTLENALKMFSNPRTWVLEVPNEKPREEFSRILVPVVEGRYIPPGSLDMKLVQRLYGNGYFSVCGSGDLSGEQQAIETYNRSTSPDI